MAISHAGHNHPATAAGRRACRASGGTGDSQANRGTDYIAEHIRKVAANGAIKTRMDREYSDAVSTYARTHHLSPKAEADMREAAAEVGLKMAGGGDCNCGDPEMRTLIHSRNCPMSPKTEDIKITGPVARRMARTAAKADNMKAERIQPRRGGARVAARNSTCVQAALHTGKGLCACGWENWS